MNKSNKYLVHRAIGYILGFALFYAPFALIQRLLTAVFHLQGRSDIHGACFNMTLQGLFSGKGIQIATTSGVVYLMILIIALLAGPFFCGKLCIAGAISEYISRIIPNRFKLNWQKHIDPTPVRYGILAGFIIIPFLGFSTACAYCNYSLMQKFILGDLGVLGSTTIITAFIWIVVLGAFAKGGRGYCSYLCPIGASQSLLHSIGSKFGFTYKMKYDSSKCISCNKCIKECPMGSLQNSDEGLTYNIHTCITCRQCEHVCPKAAIVYGRGKGEWKCVANDSNTSIELPAKEVC